MGCPGQELEHLSICIFSSCCRIVQGSYLGDSEIELLLKDSSLSLGIMSEAEEESSNSMQQRVKFLCSFGGSILPRPSDGKLRYVGGETRIVCVHRDISFSELVSKMAEFCGEAFIMKYQLPEEEDLDALVSVLCDDDLANMMEEYDKLEAAEGFTRLRVFLFSAVEGYDVSAVCIEGGDADQRYVEALNSLPESGDPRKQGFSQWIHRAESFNSLNSLNCVLPPDNGTWSRAESFSSLSSLNCGVPPDNGSIPRRIRIPHQVGVNVNSPRQQLMHGQSPPMSPLGHPRQPFSPLSHALQPAAASFQLEEPEVYHHEQPWTLGSYLRAQDLMCSCSTGSPVSYGDSMKATFEEAHPAAEDHCSWVVMNHKHCMKVFPANENYGGNSNSQDFSSPRGRIEVCNHWPEDKPAPPDILSCQPPSHHGLQNMHLLHQASADYHPTDVPMVPAEFASQKLPQRNLAISRTMSGSRLSESLEWNEAQRLSRIEVGNHWPEDKFAPSDILSCQPCAHHGPQNMHLPHQAAAEYYPADVPMVPPEFASPKLPQRNQAIPQTMSNSRLPESLEWNEAQHLSPGHMPYHATNLPINHDEVDREFVCARLSQGKPVLQSMTRSRIYEGLGRNEVRAMDNDEIDRNLEREKHIQAVWSHNGAFPEVNERKLDHINVQQAGHFEPQNSLPNHCCHLSDDRNVTWNCKLSNAGEELGLTSQNIRHAQGRFEGNSIFQYNYDKQSISEVRSPVKHCEQMPSYPDKHGSSRLEAQIHDPHYMAMEGLPMQNGSVKGDQPVPCMDNIRTHIGYEERLDRARNWVLNSRDTKYAPFGGTTPEVLTREEGILRDGGQNHCSGHDSKGYYGFKSDVSYHEPSSEFYKHATANQGKPPTHVLPNQQHMITENHLEGRAVFHLGSSYGQSHWDYNSVEETRKGISPVKRDVENPEMPHHSYISDEMSAADTRGSPLYMPDNLSRKETANTSGYDGDMQKEFNQGLSSNITVPSHHQMPRQSGILTEQAPDPFVNLEKNDTMSNNACSHPRTTSRLFLPDSLTLSTSLEVLSSALSSSHPRSNNLNSTGPPVYDQSPVSSINIIGPEELLIENEKGRQFNDSEKPEGKDFRIGQLTEKFASDIGVRNDENMGKTMLQNSLKDKSEVALCGKFINKKLAGHSFSSSCSPITSTTKCEGKQTSTASAKGEDCKELKQKSVTPGLVAEGSLPEKRVSVENPPELVEDSEKGSVNVAKNDSSVPQAHALAEGLQTIKNDDLEEIRELGSGTYGTVYYGKWKGSDVAIKRIKSSCFTGRQSEQERMRADFWREAIILGKLHHPNVVAFYGIVVDGPDGTLATVTEYMVNGSLKQVLNKKDRTIDRRKRLFIARDAACGMQYLHEKNIVHFDLKCDNLLVNMRDPHRPICKIGDLGLSKIKQRTLVSSGVRGTLPWMAPELLSGKSGKVTDKVDVYSFGIVMWELLTGEEPYAKMHCGEIIGGIMNNTLRPPVPSWCEPSWRSLMERCWSSDPGQRPSFSEIAAELRAMGEAMNLK